jgi:hypothetical protein
MNQGVKGLKDPIGSLASMRYPTNKEGMQDETIFYPDGAAKQEAKHETLF